MCSHLKPSSRFDQWHLKLTSKTVGEFILVCCGSGYVFSAQCDWWFPLPIHHVNMLDGEFKLKNYVVLILVVTCMFFWSFIHAHFFGLCRTCTYDIAIGLTHLLFWTKWGIPRYNFLCFIKFVIPTPYVHNDYWLSLCPIHNPIFTLVEECAWKLVYIFWMNNLWH
jgi:hypothetical protein